MREVARDEIGKISWIQTVKDLINYTNKFELYPVDKRRQWMSLSRKATLWLILRKKILAAEYMRD